MAGPTTPTKAEGRSKALLAVLAGETRRPPPIWLMRQAGRYLPEYRALREGAGSFLELCLTPELAAEATLQPIRRFGFDAAIIFSDILVVPWALGRRVEYAEGGPELDPFVADDLDRLADPTTTLGRLAPVLQTLRRVSSVLTEETALIGFCGAPWTVASYMIAGRGTPDQAPARRFALADPQRFAALIDVLVSASAAYLAAQLQAGADAVQIFDSWAGSLDEPAFQRWVIDPTARLVREVRRNMPDAKIIGFPKGAAGKLAAFAAETGVDAVGLDWTVTAAEARAMQARGPVQGNLEPMRLVVGGRALDDGIDTILKTLGAGPLIFNLGHGVLPETPIANVERLVARVRGRR